MPNFDTEYRPVFKYEADWDHNGRYNHAASVIRTVDGWRVFFGGDISEEDYTLSAIIAQGELRLFGEEYTAGLSNVLTEAELQRLTPVRITADDILVWDGNMVGRAVNYERKIATFKLEGKLASRLPERFQIAGDTEAPPQFAAANSDLIVARLERAAGTDLSHNLSDIKFVSNNSVDKGAGSYISDIGFYAHAVPMELRDGTLGMYSVQEGTPSLTLRDSQYAISEIMRNDRRDVFNVSHFVFPNNRTTELSGNIIDWSGIGYAPHTDRVGLTRIPVPADDTVEEKFSLTTFAVTDREFDITAQYNSTIVIDSFQALVPKYYFRPTATFSYVFNRETFTYNANQVYPLDVDSFIYSAVIRARPEVPIWDFGFHPASPNTLMQRIEPDALPTIPITIESIRAQTGTGTAGSFNTRAYRIDYEVEFPVALRKLVWNWDGTVFPFTFTSYDSEDRVQGRVGAPVTVAMTDNNLGRQDDGMQFPLGSYDYPGALFDSHSTRDNAFPGNPPLGRNFNDMATRTGSRDDTGVRALYIQFHPFIAIGDISDSLTVRNQESIDLWNPRTIQYPNIFAENQNPQLIQRINYLSTPHDQLRLSLPLYQPTKELTHNVLNIQPGTYLSLNVSDPNRSTRIRTTALVLRVLYSSRDDDLPTKVIVCVDLGRDPISNPFVLGTSLIGSSDMLV